MLDYSLKVSKRGGKLPKSGVEVPKTGVAFPKMGVELAKVGLEVELFFIGVVLLDVEFFYFRQNVVLGNGVKLTILKKPYHMQIRRSVWDYQKLSRNFNCGTRD